MNRDEGKKTAYQAGGSAAVGTKDSERRNSDRHVVTASAEVVELHSGARFSTRTTDLGPGGCFIDTTNPFSVGSRVWLVLRQGKNEFETPGVVVYSQNGLGMGITFDDIDTEQRTALERWIRELTGHVHYGTLRPPKKAEVNHFPGHASADRAALMRLIQLMITKGILTEAEGSSVFFDPVL
ncbi:MAG TPA: PilZ domain-containing protein [Candidatus Limnocylindrales bacterium]|nr:PilZ domain-containing protein [Candidatus Limnocylindrales bacterium]